MPAFSETSKKQLETCHPELQLLFNEVIKRFDHKILEGYRNETDQNLAYERGASKLKFPNGKHNAYPSMAVDAAPYPIDWTNVKRFYWFAGYVLGTADRLFSEGKMTHRLKFGGDWDGDFDITDEHGLSDLVHFELTKPRST